MNNYYNIRYLPIFYQDLSDTVSYILTVLHNKTAALSLADDIEDAVIKRSHNSLAFQPYFPSRKRSIPYYRIYVRNYVIYYVVIDNVMEVRRLPYGGRNAKNCLP